MNPARTMGPAIASNFYEGIWVYFLGPTCGTLAGAWSYNFIRVSDNSTAAALTPHLLSFKLRRMRSVDDNTPPNQNLNHV